MRSARMVSPIAASTFAIPTSIVEVVNNSLAASETA